VVTSPTAGTTEAIADGENGIVAPVDMPAAWVAAVRRLASDDGLAERFRVAGRSWVEENFDAHKNAARLCAHFEAAIAGPRP